MKIAILGYGKMGKEVEKIASEKGHEILLKINSENSLSNNDLKNTDVAIDFSTPHCVYDNIIQCFDVNVPIVVGTTGWLDKIEEIKRICVDKGQTLFFASNFSIGVNIFFELNKKLAQLMNSQVSYNVSIEETHHLQKLDKPSGTAITLANDIIKNNKSTQDTDLQIISNRENNITGTHVINYSSEIDSIEIKHTANNRKGFAIGAMLAAEWVIGKKGVFGMKELLST